MSEKKFNIPEGLKGKIFNADEYFREKKNRMGADFLLENLSGTERIEEEDGSYILRRVEIPLDKGISEDLYRFPGEFGMPDMDREALTLISGEEWWNPSDISKIIFFDLETTGLAGGAGTWPFLCGIGWYEENSFVVEQYFMEDYPYEGIMLRGLTEKMKKAEALVTFNGKTFDVPLLKTRLIFNRMRLNLEIPHIDLLHPSRRLWRGVFPDCSLGSIEENFFGLKRARDIDSSLIPMIYFNYVRGRRREMMLPVFDHNVQDVATLGSLLLFFCRAINSPMTSLLKSPKAFFGLGRWLLKLGRREQATECFDHALNAAREPELRERLLWHTGMMHKKMESWESALEAWERLMKESMQRRIDAAVEIAKYYEHRVKQPDRAREIIIMAVHGDKISEELREYLEGPSCAGESRLTPGLEKRLRRLEKKIKKNEYIDPSEDE